MGSEGGDLIVVVSSTVQSPEVEGCIELMIEQMRFQKPNGGICISRR